MKSLSVSLKRLPFLSAAIAVTFAASAADGTWVARDGVGTSVANFAAWSDAANWEDGTVPTSLDADTATLTNATKAGQYIRLDDASLALKAVNGWIMNAGGRRAVLVGDGAFQVSYAGNLTGVCLYAPWRRTGGATGASVYTGLWNAEICGDCSGYHHNSLVKDTVTFRYVRLTPHPERRCARRPDCAARHGRGAGGDVLPDGRLAVPAAGRRA